MSETKPQAKVTVNTFRQMKQKGEKISMLTAYDYNRKESALMVLFASPLLTFIT